MWGDGILTVILTNVRKCQITFQELISCTKTTAVEEYNNNNTDRLGEIYKTIKKKKKIKVT